MEGKQASSGRELEERKQKIEELEAKVTKLEASNRELELENKKQALLIRGLEIYRREPSSN